MMGTHMPKVIDVYVKKREVLTKPSCVGQPLGEYYSIYKETYKSEKIMSEEEMSAIRIAQKISDEEGLKLRLHDISTFMGMIHARLRGIKKTPTIVVDKTRLERVPSEEELLSMLK